ncbi:hypothetical protein BACI349Y_800026 [Bacillus sp. 349Y]|nr:hypothetical protein BACI349Y_800026 [Bacillus sp. 349Y]
MIIPPCQVRADWAYQWERTIVTYIQGKNGDQLPNYLNKIIIYKYTIDFINIHTYNYT